MWNQLGLSGSPAQINPTGLKWGELKEGAAIGDVQAVFPRIDKAKTMAEINPAAERGFMPRSRCVAAVLRVRKQNNLRRR